MKNSVKTVIHLVDNIRSALSRLKKDGAVIGVSGGIDSAVTLKLVDKCLPRNRILPLILPDRDSNPRCIQYAEQICRDYETSKISITPLLQRLGIYRGFKNYAFIPRRIKEEYSRKKLEYYGQKIYLRFLRGDLDPDLRKALSYVRIKNRMRMAIMYHHAEMRNYAVVGTINKTEYLLGFFVPFGDGVADIMPLLELYKTDLWTIARTLNIPEEIVTQAPTPDLIPGLTDEMILGMSYERIDEILKEVMDSTVENLETEESRYIGELYTRAKDLRALLFPIQKDSVNHIVL